MHHVAVPYTERYLDYCPESHPYWNLGRFSVVFELFKTLGWNNHPSIQVFEPQEATDEEIEVYHHPEGRIFGPA